MNVKTEIQVKFLFCVCTSNFREVSQSVPAGPPLGPPLVYNIIMYFAFAIKSQCGPKVTNSHQIQAEYFLHKTIFAVKET